jgi:hypothetical protein
MQIKPLRLASGAPVEHDGASMPAVPCTPEKFV